MANPIRKKIHIVTEGNQITGSIYKVCSNGASETVSISNWNISDSSTVIVPNASTLINVQPDQILAGDMIISTEYELITKTSDFGSLVSGDSITVDSVSYTVRDLRKENDGVFCRISLQKT